MRYVVLVILLISVCATSVYGEFERVLSIPRAVKRPFGNISALFMPDGRLVVWNGDTVYRQPIPGADAVAPVASGYVGDTAFMALSPARRTLLLGAGMSGKLYRLDLAVPADYGPAADLGVYGHYWGAFLNETLAVIDRLADDYSTDELAVIDVSQPGLAPRVVMQKPAPGEIPPGGFAASAALAVDAAGDYVYAMAVVFDASFNVAANPLKKVPVDDIVAAYAAQSTLNWADYAAVGPGPYATGGPVAVTRDGDLILAGFGGVEFVDGHGGAVLDTYSPAGFVYYGAAYDPAADLVFPLATDTADYTMDLLFAPAGALNALPAVRAGALALLTAGMTICGMRRVWILG